MKPIAGELSDYINVATDAAGAGLKFCIQLDTGVYTEFVMHETECVELLKFLKEALPGE